MFDARCFMNSRTLLHKSSFLWMATFVAALVSCTACHTSHAQTSESSASASPASVGIKYAADFDWHASSSTDLNSPGSKTVNLNSCPSGVLANEPWYYVYISGSGKPEAVKVTGGTCHGDRRPGTLEFTTLNAHSSGYAIGSASGGIQEASMAARIKSDFKTLTAAKQGQGGKVVIAPGEYNIYAPISIRASYQTLDFSGSVVNCYTPNDACIFIGDHGPSTLFQNITLINPCGRPMVIASTKPFIEDNGSKTTLYNVVTRYSWEGSAFASFGAYVQVDDDQAFTLDGLDTNASGTGATCNEKYCGAVITAPGPFNHWSAVGWLKHLNLSLECAKTGIDWQSGNGLKISDSVIQGWAYYAVRTGSRRGGTGTFISDNVYYEPSASCMKYNPLGNVGTAAIINQGGTVKLSGAAANGASGVFPNWGAAADSRTWLYWVVPVHAGYGDGVPLPAGYARTNGSSKIAATFPRITGASSYKILKIDWDASGSPPYPEGTGNYLLTTVQQSACTKGDALPGTCEFTDSGAKLSSYTNAAEILDRNVYIPLLDFWPGAIVMGAAQDFSTANFSSIAPPLQADVLGERAIVSTLPAGIITGVAHSLIPTSALPPAAANLEAMNTNAGSIPGATILKSANSISNPVNGLKGRLNFGHHGAPASFTPLITLGDSNWGKTWATADHRPQADVNDLDLGYEGNIDTLYSRAQSGIREYVGKLPDGSPQERLDASAKTFNVPVTINGNLTVTGKCSGCGSGGGASASASAQLKIYKTSSVAKVSVPAQHCLDVSSAATGLVAADQITGITPPAALGNLSLNAYTVAANKLTLHFCNPSTAAVDAPAGVYSFLAVH